VSRVPKRIDAIRRWNETVEILSGLMPDLLFVRRDEFVRGGLPASSYRGRGGLGTPVERDQYDKAFGRIERDQLADIRQLHAIALRMQRRQNRMLLPRDRTDEE
jgi:hypothetical protein